MTIMIGATSILAGGNAPAVSSSPTDHYEEKKGCDAGANDACDERRQPSSAAVLVAPVPQKETHSSSSIHHHHHHHQQAEVAVVQQQQQQQQQQQPQHNAYNTPTYLHTQPDFTPTFTDLLPPPPKSEQDKEEAERARIEEEEKRRRAAARASSSYSYNPSYALSLLSMSEFTITAIPHPFDITEPADLQSPLEAEFRPVLTTICKEHCSGDGGSSGSASSADETGGNNDGTTSGSEDDRSSKSKVSSPALVFDEGKWRIPLGAYRPFHTFLTSKIGPARVEGIPDVQLKAATMGRQRLDRSYPTAEDLMGKGVPPGLATALAPYQRGGVDFCLERKGRALIADDMGLGKTIQAIATMSCYANDWPLLVLCPSSARYHWEAEFRQWLGRKSSVNRKDRNEDAGIGRNGVDEPLKKSGVDEPLKKRPRVSTEAGAGDDDRKSCPMKLLRKSEIHVINSSSDAAFAKPDSKIRVAICSYGLVLNLVAKKNLFPGCFRAAIVDESHMLKDKSSKRTKALVPILKHTKYCLMLSGTPSLARPRDLWPQFNILGACCHSNKNDCGNREVMKGETSWWQDEEQFLATYVKGKNKRGKANNFAQLHTLATATVMIRRTKADMLKDMPPKKRSQIRVAISDDKTLDEFEQYMRILRNGKGALGKIARAQHGCTNDVNTPADGEDGPPAARRNILNKMYSLTGRSKVPTVVFMLKKWLADPTKGKICLFAHHTSVLDDIVSGAGLSNADGSLTKYIRIDGSTLPKARQDHITTFQNDPTTRVAILSITAASVAVTLTAASTVWFAELFWTPSIMLQAEDRCHRIGQQSTVRCSYFFGEGTLDELLWKLIEKKYRNLGEFVEGKENSKITIHEADGNCLGEERKCDDVGKPAGLSTLPEDEELRQDIVALGMEEEAMLKAGVDESDDGDECSPSQDPSSKSPTFDIAMPLPRMLLYKVDFARNFGFVISPFQGRMVVKSKSSKRVQELGMSAKPDVGDILVMINGVYLPRNVEYREILMMLKNALQNPPAELVFAEGGHEFQQRFCRIEGLSMPPLPQPQVRQASPTAGLPFRLNQTRSYSLHFNGNYGIIISPLQGRMVVKGKSPRRILEFGEHSKPSISDILVAINGEHIAPGTDYTKVLMTLKYAMMQPPAELTFEEGPGLEAYSNTNER